MPRKKSKVSKRRKPSILSRHLARLRGSATLILLILVVIIGSVLLAGGLFPNEKNKLPSGNAGEFIVDTTGSQQNPSQNALQLQTLKFKACTQTANTTMQLDITGSMSNAIDDLKNAVFSFTDSLSNDSIIGIQAYSSINARQEVVPVGYYKDVKSQIRPNVGALTAGGSTPSYDALNYSREVLEAAKTKYPDKQFTFIFFSDGRPNVGPSTTDDIKQAAQGIKDLGVTVYSIGFGGINKEVLEAVASSPDKAFYTNNSDDLPGIYKQIAIKLCQ